MISLAQLVSRLPYSRSYYATVEEMMLALCKDSSEAVFAAVEARLLPALLQYTHASDILTTSLLPKVCVSHLPCSHTDCHHVCCVTTNRQDWTSGTGLACCVLRVEF